MKTIKVGNKGHFAIVDDEDYDWLNQWKWNLVGSGYVSRIEYYRGEKIKKRIKMHRLINKTPAGMDTDHINGNRLDNRKVNLRSVTRSQNNMNTGLWKHNTSGYKGVGWHKGLKKWVARIQVNSKQIYLGNYPNIQKALLGRKKAEEFYFGKFAKVAEVLGLNDEA